VDRVSREACETERVERARDHVGEPEHPTDAERRIDREHLLGVDVPAAGLGEHRGEFGERERRDERHDPVQREREDRARPGHLHSDAAEHEDARADHGADPDHRGPEEPQLPIRPFAHASGAS